MPSVNQLYSQLKGRGLAVLLVSFREDPGLVKRTVHERGYVTPVLLDRSGDVTGKLYGVWGTPTSYLIDRQGRLLGRIVGARPWDSPAARSLLLDLIERR